MAVLDILKILFLYCGGTTYPISTEDALYVYVINIYYIYILINRLSSKTKITIISHYSPFAKIDLITKNTCGMSE